MMKWVFTVRFPFMGETVDVAGVIDAPTDQPDEVRTLLIGRGVPADQIVDVRRARGDAYLSRNDRAWGKQISRFEDAQRAIELRVKAWEGD